VIDHAGGHRRRRRELGVPVAPDQQDARVEGLAGVRLDPVHEQPLALLDAVLLAADGDDRVAHSKENARLSGGRQRSELEYGPSPSAGPCRREYLAASSSSQPWSSSRPLPAGPRLRPPRPHPPSPRPPRHPRRLGLRTRPWLPPSARPACASPSKPRPRGSGG